MKLEDVYFQKPELKPYLAKSVKWFLPFSIKPIFYELRTFLVSEDDLYDYITTEDSLLIEIE